MIDLKTFESLLNISGFRRKRRDLTVNRLESMTKEQAQEMMQTPGQAQANVDHAAVNKAAFTNSAAQRAINAEAAERERQSRERRAKLTQTRLESVVATGRFAG